MPITNFWTTEWQAQEVALDAAMTEEFTAEVMEEMEIPTLTTTGTTAAGGTTFAGNVANPWMTYAKSRAQRAPSSIKEHLKDLTVEEQGNVTNAFMKLLVKAFGPTLFIAGGAPLDWSHGKVAKDVDVFIPTENHTGDSLEQAYRALLKSAGKHIHEDRYTASSGKNRDPALSYEIYDVNKVVYRGLTFDLIFYITPYQTSPIGLKGEEAFVEHILERFDINLCKIYQTSNFERKRAPSQIQDEQMKTLTVPRPQGVPGSPNHAKHVRHAERMKTKYPDFKLIYPKQLNLGRVL